MEYTELVLKLANDVAKLEESNHELRRKIEKISEHISGFNFENESKTEQNIHSKRLSKDEVISLISSKAAQFDLKIKKASMSEGGGVVAKYHNQEPKRVMLKMSKNYEPENNKVAFRAWHTLSVEALEEYDAYIFTVEYGEDIEVFIFTAPELKQYVSDKVTTPRNDDEVYHFYFSKQKDGKYVDQRDQDKETTKYHNNWNALK